MHAPHVPYHSFGTINHLRPMIWLSQSFSAAPHASSFYITATTSPMHQQDITLHQSSLLLATHTLLTVKTQPEITRNFPCWCSRRASLDESKNESKTLENSFESCGSYTLAHARRKKYYYFSVWFYFHAMADSLALPEARMRFQVYLFIQGGT